MALDDIKKSVIADAEKEAQAVLKAGQKELGVIRGDWEKRIEENKNVLLATTKRRAQQKVQQADFMVQSQAQAKVLSKKQALISQVYQKALDKLSALDDKEYVLLMKKLISSLPDTKGELISAKGKTSLLKKALVESKTDYKLSESELSIEGGFIFKSPTVEIDNTFATLVGGNKDQTILEVSQIIFDVKQ